MAAAVMKYFPESDKAQKGHMQQSKQGLQSMKQIKEEQEPHVVFSPQTRVREINVHIEDMECIMYTDHTRQFSVVSSQGNRYIMVLYKTDGSLILLKPMTNRTSREICKAYEVINRMNQNGIKIKNTFLTMKHQKSFSK